MEKLLKEEELVWLRSTLDVSQKIVILAHVGPDGDALGTTLALWHWLTRKGKQAVVVCPNVFPDFLNWMPGIKDVLIYSKQADDVKKVLAEADLQFFVDLNQPSRLRELEEPVMEAHVTRIMIDHHLDPDRQVCQLIVSHPEMCAASEVLCHLFWQMGELEHLTQTEAACLYTGMMCDTGAFTYNSSRSVVYECIGLLLARGIDKDKIYRNVYFTCSPARMKLMGFMLYVKLEVLNESNASIMTLTNAERRMFNCKNGDTEGFVNLPLQILGMKLSVFLSEDTEHPGLVKVSLRSVDDFPCNEMSARFFDGGGHKNASGGRLHCTMDEAVEKVKAAITYYSSLLKA